MLAHGTHPDAALEAIRHAGHQSLGKGIVPKAFLDRYAGVAAELDALLATKLIVARQEAQAQDPAA